MGVGVGGQAFPVASDSERLGYVALAAYVVLCFMARSPLGGVSAFILSALVGFVAAFLLPRWWIVPALAFAPLLLTGQFGGPTPLANAIGALYVAVYAALPGVAGLLASAVVASRQGRPMSLQLSPPDLARITPASAATGVYLVLLVVFVARVGDAALDDAWIWSLVVAGLAAGYLNPKPLIPLAGAAAVAAVMTEQGGEALRLAVPLALTPALLGFAAAALKDAPPTDDRRAEPLMAATYLSLAVLTVVLFAVADYPGLFAGGELGSARDSAIDAWRTRYLVIGLPGTAIVVAVALAWLRTFARPPRVLLCTVVPAALLAAAILWPSLISFVVVLLFSSGDWPGAAALLTLMVVAAGIVAVASAAKGVRLLHGIAFWVATTWAAVLAFLSLYMSEGTFG